MKDYANYPKASISMSKDAHFIASIDRLFKENKITHVLESGTYLGLGSTTTLATAISKNNVPIEQFITVEIDSKSYSAARTNLRSFPFVTPVLGLTVGIDEARHFLENDEAITNHENYPDIFIDTTDNPRAKYLNELNGKLSGDSENMLTRMLYSLIAIKSRDNLLAKYLPPMIGKNPLILLDSAGGIGFLEFQTVLNIMGGATYFLILDDIHHLKHFRSRLHIKGSNEFSLIAESIEDGWLIAKHH